MQRNSLDQLRNLIDEEKKLILDIVAEHPAETCGRQVLIDRLRGLEDSSRNWSVYMVVEHLRIVNEVIGLSIRSLGRGKVPSGKVSTADVKPSPDLDEEAMVQFVRACDLLQNCAEKVDDLHTSVKISTPLVWAAGCLRMVCPRGFSHAAPS